MAHTRVLQLVTTPRPFFRQQVRALADQGVTCTTVSVPAAAGDRGPIEYLSFAIRSLVHSLDSFDLVHANYGLTGPVALAQPRRPVVLTLWGSDLMGESTVATRLSRGAARHADAVVVPSQTMAAELSSPHRIVPFGVDTQLFRPMDKATARAEVGWDPTERIVLFPYDTDRPVKNAALARQVVDDLPMEATLRTISEVPYRRVPTYMNASDALLVTSRRESGPMVVPEAVACGLPVVSTDVGFVADLLADVDTAAVGQGRTELVEALARILADGSRIGTRATVPSLEEMAKELIEVYDDVLDTTPRPHRASMEPTAE